MKKFSLDEGRAYLLAQAREYPVEIKEKRPAVTNSRETGAGAITIGQILTSQLAGTLAGVPELYSDQATLSSYEVCAYMRERKA